MTIRIGALAMLCCALLGLAGCGLIAAQTYDGAKEAYNDLRPKDITTKSVRSIKTVTVSRIAVMPLADDPQGSDPLAPGASDAVSAELYSQAALAGSWEVVPQDDVVQAMQKLPPNSVKDLDENAAKVGRLVSADGVLYGSVERYQERVGLDYAAASPASVTFKLQFLDMKSGQVVWHADFAKSQKALSQNIFNLVNFVQNQGRWVRAHEIAMEGVKEAIADLHGNLNLQPNIKHFETGTYGELRSGRQRYDRQGPTGLYGQE
ncbi:MAG TPA: hypothetical protein VEC38_13730 [Candidatus Binataceae bacterium]|nr:hypothetical protein [Candidatus Binataceae bacterium]